jgi:hypothetical protein
VCHNVNTVHVFYGKTPRVVLFSLKDLGSLLECNRAILDHIALGLIVLLE